MQRPGQRPGAGAGQRPGGGDRTQIGGGDRTNIGGGDRNTNIDRGDINIDSDIDVDGGWGGWSDYPVGAGLVAGAVAGVTAAAIGSYYYSLPVGCPPYPYGGYTYYSCGGAYYQPQYEGDTVVYVTVPDPTQGDVTVVQD